MPFAAPTAATSGTITAMANTNAVAVWWLGSKASTTVGDGITTTTIKGMTVTAGKKAALNLKLNAATDDDVSLARITIGGSVIGTSPLTAIGDTNQTLPFTAPTTAGTYEAVVEWAGPGGVLHYCLPPTHHTPRSKQRLVKGTAAAPHHLFCSGQAGLRVEESGTT